MHYFASSFHTWRVSEDFDQVIRLMDKLHTEDESYKVWRVPLPIDATYQISATLGPLSGYDENTGPVPMEGVELLCEKQEN